MYKNSDNHVLVLSFLKRKISFFEKKKFLSLCEVKIKVKKIHVRVHMMFFFLKTSVYFIESIKPGDLHG